MYEILLIEWMISLHISFWLFPAECGSINMFADGGGSSEQELKQNMDIGMIVIIMYAVFFIFVYED